jgi:hypothetical protein
MKREYLKDKTNELAMNSSKKSIRDLFTSMNEFKRGYHPRSNLVKNKNGDQLADSSNILNRWKNYIFLLLNVNGVCEVMQREVHIAVPLEVPVMFN